VIKKWKEEVQAAAEVSKAVVAAAVGSMAAEEGSMAAGAALMAAGEDSMAAEEGSMAAGEALMAAGEASKGVEVIHGRRTTCNNQATYSGYSHMVPGEENLKRLKKSLSEMRGKRQCWKTLKKGEDNA
jgi:hypothetical protein